MRKIKPWDKPVRVYPSKLGLWGITDWMVGTCNYPWSPWIQIHLGKTCIQIKYYVLVLLLIVTAFLLGRYL